MLEIEVEVRLSVIQKRPVRAAALQRRSMSLRCCVVLLLFAHSDSADGTVRRAYTTITFIPPPTPLAISRGACVHGQPEVSEEEALRLDVRDKRRSDFCRSGCAYENKFRSDGLRNRVQLKQVPHFGCFFFLPLDLRGGVRRRRRRIGCE